jgi:demethylmenaquinone methyltransferase/2-methoxy-6-polyprenyl-1,4-benzoquinol methylase
MIDQHREHYNRIAQEYTGLIEQRLFWLGGERRFRQLIFDTVKPYIFGNVLELCCGPGNFTSVLAENLPHLQIDASDLSEGFIEQASQRYQYPNVRFSVQNATRLPYPDNSFETAIISLALHEMEAPTIQTVLREIKRVLTDTGSAILIEHHLPAHPFARLIYDRYVVFEGERETAYAFHHYGFKRHVNESGLLYRAHHLLFFGCMQVIVAHRGSAQPFVETQRDLSSVMPYEQIWHHFYSLWAAPQPGPAANPPAPQHNPQGDRHDAD